jgi:phospholipid transport system substrate-binding protein
VLAQIKNDKAIQAGDVGKIATLVDQKIMPYVDFQRMTASAVGRNWRSATPEQQAKIQAEFKTLLVRTYAGALSQVRNHTISVKPLRAAPSDTEVVVKSELKSGSQQPIALDYRLEKTAQGWRVYDMNVMGVWLIETYRADFGSVINAGGIDNLIAKLQERNKANAAKS